MGGGRGWEAGAPLCAQAHTDTQWLGRITLYPRTWGSDPDPVASCNVATAGQTCLHEHTARHIYMSRVTSRGIAYLIYPWQTFRSR